MEKRDKAKYRLIIGIGIGFVIGIVIYSFLFGK